MHAPRRPPIIALALDAWTGPWMNRHHLLTRLGARGWPVVYSNGPRSIWERNRPDWALAPLFNGLEQRDGVLVDHPGRLCAIWPRSKLWTTAAYATHARHLLYAAGRDRRKSAICYVFHPYMAHYTGRLGLDRIVYHAYDDYARTVDWTPELARRERELVARSRLVIASSPGIARGLVERHPRAVPRIVPNGVDAARFAAGRGAPCPPDLASIPRPRIGYTGRVTPSVDLHLLSRLAAERRDWQWVVVGPVLLEASVAPEAERMVRAHLAACQALPNVHFLGGKSVADLPAYMGNMDVNLMCYRTDEGGWWSAVYPLKMHEYLAAGQPVVSSNLEAVRPFSEVIAVVAGLDQWLAAIADALDGSGVGTPARRQAVARANSWEHRVDQLEQCLTVLA